MCTEDSGGGLGPLVSSGQATNERHSKTTTGPVITNTENGE